MSYARFGSDSDVYVFKHIDGFLTCCSCLLHKRIDPQYYKTKDMIAHLLIHEAKGHKVPKQTLDRLIADAPTNDYFMKRRRKQGVASAR